MVISRGLAEDVLTACKGDHVTQSPYGDYEDCAGNSAYCMLLSHDSRLVTR
jgi:hypothetical protein